jgi:glycosyltransferase involved in cell wall biosynthesis
LTWIRHAAVVRIAFVSDTYTPEVNGVTTVLRRMVDAVRAAAHDVTVVAPRYPHGQTARSGELRVRSIRCPFYPAVRLSLPAWRRVGWYLDRFKPDLVHVATEGPLGLLGRRYSRTRRRPLVTSSHTDFPGYCQHYGASSLAPLVWHWLTWFHRPAALTHTPGEAMQAELVRRGIVQAVVWGCAVDTEEFTPQRRSHDLRRALKIADNQMFVVHVGRLAPEKNLDVLVDAFALAREAIRERLAFAVAGRGPVEARMAARAPWLLQLRFLDRDNLAQLYASADVIVLPSATETCGLVALEAMASGLAVIAADARGFRESIRPGSDGLLVPPTDPLAFAEAIVRLALNTAERRHLAHAARAAALRRDVRQENAELLSQYGALTSHAVEVPAWRAA